MKKVVITGGTKLIGGYLSNELLSRGYEVHVTGTTRPEKSHEPAILHIVDVRDAAAMADICSGATFIFHLAARGDQACIDDPTDAEAVNVGGTTIMLEIAKKIGIEKFVFASSAMVYGEQPTVPFREDMAVQPTEPYGLYKQLGEELIWFWAKQYEVPAVSLRFFNAYGLGDVVGPNGYVIGRFLHLRMQDQPLTIDGEGTDTRDYVHAADIARACLAAAERADIRAGETINIGSGVETSLNDLAALIGGEVIHMPSRPGARRGPSRRVADISKARSTLKWKPEISIQNGIAQLKREFGIS